MLTKTLIRLFVKHPDEKSDPSVRYAYGQLAGFTGLGCNALLFLVKLLAGILSGSLAIIADAFNNLSDAGSVVVTLVGFKLSNRPADKDHPFGHGRIEYLSALAVAVLIILAGFELASSAWDKILHPTPAEFNLLTMIILAAAIGIKLWMAGFYNRIGRTIQSDALTASGIDSRNDVICTGVVLVSSFIGWRTSWCIDGYVGMAVALFVIWAGFSIIRETVSPLLGQMPDPELVKDMEETVLAHEGVVGIHDVMVHDYGPGRIYASLHAEVPASQDILISHDIVDCVEQELMDKFRMICCIHLDPVDTDNPETLRLKALMKDILHSIDETITLHDFRVVIGETHTNLIFDVVVPFSYKQRNTLEETIQRELHRQEPKCFAVIKIENQYA